jgi:hypothetical protein
VCGSPRLVGKAFVALSKGIMGSMRRFDSGGREPQVQLYRSKMLEPKPMNAGATSGRVRRGEVTFGAM